MLLPSNAGDPASMVAQAMAVYSQLGGLAGGGGGSRDEPKGTKVEHGASPIEGQENEGLDASVNGTLSLLGESNIPHAALHNNIKLSIDHGSESSPSEFSLQQRA